MLRANFHTHTTFCDGKSTAEEMAERAVALGFAQLGFSGHMDADIHMDFDAYAEEIMRLRDKYRGRLDILLGVELDSLYDPCWAERAEYVIGSTHFLEAGGDLLPVDSTPELFRRLAEEYYGGDYYRLAKAYFALEAEVHDRTHCTFVGHFDLVTRFNDELRVLDEEDPRYTGPALEAMEYLVSRGVPFEINCGAFNRGRKRELYPNRFLLRALREFGGEILISSDAHQAELLDGGFPTALRTASACGFRYVSILRHDEKGRVVREELALDTLLADS